MRRITSALAAGLLALGLAGAAGGTDKVEICHFPGHADTDSAHTDWYITGAGLHCEAEGGQVLTVSVKGAENGHGAVAHSPDMHG